MQHLLHQIKAQQFYTDLDLNQQCYDLQKIEKFKGSSRHLSVFQYLIFKAYMYLIFKDFSRKPSKFRYFSTCANPVVNTIFTSDFQSFKEQLSTYIINLCVNEYFNSVLRINM